VLVGINYVGQQGELRGCHNDILLMMESEGFGKVADIMFSVKYIV